MNDSTSFDPFGILGVSEDASEAEIRARYLELVKQFPPDRDPDKFREVQAAFDSAKDPLSIAMRLLMPPSTEAPGWSDALEKQKQIPPALRPMLLLSFGNRDDASSRERGDSKLRSDQDQDTDGNPHDGNPQQKQHYVERPHE